MTEISTPDPVMSGRKAMRAGVHGSDSNVGRARLGALPSFPGKGGGLAPRPCSRRCRDPAGARCPATLTRTATGGAS